jgi:hypothetical protein
LLHLVYNHLEILKIISNGRVSSHAAKPSRPF